MKKLYLLATDTKKHVSGIIRSITGEKYNHASVAFDPGLKECFSFNIGRNGFVRELKSEWPAGTEFELRSITVTEAGYIRAKEFVTNESKSGKTFNFVGMTSTFTGIATDSDETKFCSQFIEEVCQVAGASPEFTHTSFSTPQKVVQRNGSKLVAEGVLHNYIVMNGIASKRLYEGFEDMETVLTEGAISNMLRNLATGDIEGEIKDLKGEAKDIHTPEQQRYVLGKIVRLLETLIVLRHNPGFVNKKFHDSMSWFGRVMGRDANSKQLSLRVGEAIRDLSSLRDQVLAKKWSDETYNKKVDEIREKMQKIIDTASNKQLEED